MELTAMTAVVSMMIRIIVLMEVNKSLDTHQWTTELMETL
jgi:hypothetical protein